MSILTCATAPIAATRNTSALISVLWAFLFRSKATACTRRKASSAACVFCATSSARRMRSRYAGRCGHKGPVRTGFPGFGTSYSGNFCDLFSGSSPLHTLTCGLERTTPAMCRIILRSGQPVTVGRPHPGIRTTKKGNTMETRMPVLSIICAIFLICAGTSANPYPESPG